MPISANHLRATRRRGLLRELSPGRRLAVHRTGIYNKLVTTYYVKAEELILLGEVSYISLTTYLTLHIAKYTI